MKKWFTNNLGLKLLSIVVAFALWLIVINYDDPVATATFSGIKVEIINASELTDKGQVYEILNNSDTVTVKVEAKRSVLDTIQESNIHAVADMRDITARHTIAIQVYTNKNNDQLENIYANRKDLELSVEDLKTVHLPVAVYTSGEPAEGFVVGDITQTQNTVRVSGPESVIDTIDHAECYVSVADRYSDISASADIRLFDENDVRVEHANLTTNISSINVTVTILATKAVDIVYEYSGAPAEGYAVAGEPTADRTAVYLAGRQNVLDPIWQLSIPETALDISDATEDAVFTVNIEDYLPSDTRLVRDTEDFDGTVRVRVPIVPMVERSFHVPIENLSAVGVPEGYEAEILLDANVAGELGDGEETEEQVYLRIRTQGIQEDYGDLSGTEITGTVDVGEYVETYIDGTLHEGVYHMEITLDLPEGVAAMDVYYAEVRITEKAED